MHKYRKMMQTDRRSGDPRRRPTTIKRMAAKFTSSRVSVNTEVNR
jgi:hypothetical protein